MTLVAKLRKLVERWQVDSWDEGLGCARELRETLEGHEKEIEVWMAGNACGMGVPRTNGSGVCTRHKNHAGNCAD